MRGMLTPPQEPSDKMANRSALRCLGFCHILQLSGILALACPRANAVVMTRMLANSQQRVLTIPAQTAAIAGDLDGAIFRAPRPPHRGRTSTHALDRWRHSCSFHGRAPVGTRLRRKNNAVLNMCRCCVVARPERGSTATSSHYLQLWPPQQEATQLTCHTQIWRQDHVSETALNPKPQNLNFRVCFMAHGGQGLV